jgi:hypothetical protein
MKGNSRKAPLPPLSVSGKQAPSSYITVGANVDPVSKNKNLSGFISEI